VRSLAELPTGTVTFLFTDIEGSTRLWEEYPKAMPDAVARHDATHAEAESANAAAADFVVKNMADLIQLDNTHVGDYFFDETA
jgi:class 3 adenylate cyclase